MIIVTRPSPFGEELTCYLNEKGYSAKHVPLFKIKLNDDLVRIDANFSALKSNDIVIFTSPQLALIFKDYQLPDSLRYFAVGAATADRIKLTQSKNLNIQVPKQQDSEGLISLLDELKIDFTQTQILLAKGNQGRNYLQQQLNLRCAKVSELICYERKLIKEPFEKIDLIGNNECYFIATSCDHVRRLSELVSKQQKKEILIVNHQKQRELALSLNWQRVFLVGPQNVRLSEAILELIQSLNQ